MPCIPRDWRTRHQRYRLAAAQCEVCGVIVFPPRPICATCSRSGKANQRPKSTEMPVFVVACPAETASLSDQAAGEIASAQGALPGQPLTLLTERLGEAGEGEQVIFG